MTRRRHAKIGGTADPATSPVSGPDLRHVTLLPRHHRAMTIDAAKSISFEEETTVLNLKLVYKKC